MRLALITAICFALTAATSFAGDDWKPVQNGSAKINVAPLQSPSQKSRAPMQKPFQKGIAEMGNPVSSSDELVEPPLP